MFQAEDGIRGLVRSRVLGDVYKRQEWEDLTTKMGYWVDMENPYITYDNKYIETLWLSLIHI